MDIKEIASALNNVCEVKSNLANEWEVAVKTQLPGGFQIKVFIKNIAGKWYFCDNKNTLKFMNNMYELGSLDVKNCISGVLKVYGFTVTAGEIFAVIKSQKDIVQKFYQFICCMAELVNMYVFFDKP